MEKNTIPHGEKMISFKIRFFANDLTNKKMVWDSGAITIVTNRSRGLRNAPTNHEFFHGLDDIGNTVKKMLKRNDIVVVRKQKGSEDLLVVNLNS